MVAILFQKIVFYSTELFAKIDQYLPNIIFCEICFPHDYGCPRMAENVQRTAYDIWNKTKDNLSPHVEIPKSLYVFVRVHRQFHKMLQDKIGVATS